MPLVTIIPYYFTPVGPGPEPEPSPIGDFILDAYDLIFLRGNEPEGRDNSGSSIVDVSPNNAELTVTGEVKVGAVNPFSTSWAAHFDGTNDGYTATLPGGLGSGDFTIEMWVYIESFYDWITFISLTRGANGFNFGTDASKDFVWYDSGARQLEVVGAFSAHTWHHVAVVRDSGTLRGFLDGTEIQTDPNSVNFSDTNLGIAHLVGAGQEYFPGYISNLRISNTARYTSGFTPQSYAFKADAYTRVLLFNDGTVYDHGLERLTLTSLDNPKLLAFGPVLPKQDSIFSEAIRNCAYFPGTGNYMTVPYNTANFDWSSGNITVELWIFPTNASSLSYNPGDTDHPTVIGNRSATATSDYWSFGPNTNLDLVFYFYSGTPNLRTSNLDVNLNEWNHIGFTITPSSTITFFANGVIDQTTQSISGLLNGNELPLTLGQGNNAGFEGLMSNARIVSGQALYSGTTYTVPTAPLEVQEHDTIVMLCQDKVLTKDRSENDSAVTVTGNVEILGFSPFDTSPSSDDVYSPKASGNAILFDSSATDYVIVNNDKSLALGNGDFTIEGWVYHTDSGVLSVMDQRPDSSNGSYPHIYLSSNSVYYHANSSTHISGSINLPLNTWNHIAVVRKDGTTKLYVNGVQDGSDYADSTDYADQRVIVGAGSVSYNAPFDGKIADFRFVKGRAVYSDNFVPGAIERSSDELLHIYGRVGLLDYSGRTLIHSLGNASSDALDSKYNTSSIHFDGSGDALVIETDEKYAFGTGDFTIEAFVKFNSLSGNQIIYDQRPGSAGAYPVLYAGGDTIRYHVSGSDRITSSALTTGTWYHIAVCRSGTDTKMFIEGTQAGGTWTDSTDYQQGALRLGVGYADTEYLNGNIDYLRIAKTARYTDTFDAPEETITYVAASGGDMSESEDYITHIFTDDGSFVVTDPGEVETIVVGGGAGGGFGGGGAGSVVHHPALRLESDSYSVVVGDGGVGATGSTEATDGDDSSLASLLLAPGGGRGASNYNGEGVNKGNGSPGGCGGGGAQHEFGEVSSGGSSVVEANRGAIVHGNRGGTGYRNGGNEGGGGGGGAGTPGEDIGTSQSGNVGGAGGHGILSDVDGILRYFGGGGGGGYTAVPGLGGGGKGTAWAVPANDGLNRLGGGGGGTAANGAPCGDGGKGSVAVRYAKRPEYSMYFDGDSQVSMSGSASIGTGDFTMEAWIYPNTLINNDAIIAEHWSTVSAGFIFRVFTGGNLSIYDGSANRTGNIAIKTKQWQHVAASRQSGTLKLFVNGVEALSVATSSSMTGPGNGESLAVGGFHNTASNKFNGYISNARVLVGSALYTEAFTPSSSPLAPVEDTLLLTCNRDSIIDSVGQALTPTGSPMPVRQHPFNGGKYSFYFDGTGDYIDVASSVDFAFGTGDFTIEAWIYPQGSGSFHIYGSNTSGTGGYTLTMNSSNQFHAWRHGDTPTTSSNTYARNTWHHVAVVMISGTQKVYINGVEDAGLTYNPASISDTTANIGHVQGLTTDKGYISNLRVVKGTGVYTGNFTPSKEPLTDITGTVLLCNSNKFVDEKGKALTVNGDVKVSQNNPFIHIREFPNKNALVALNAANGVTGYTIGTSDKLSALNNGSYFQCQAAQSYSDAKRYHHDSSILVTTTDDIYIQRDNWAGVHTYDQMTFECWVQFSSSLSSSGFSMFRDQTSNNDRFLIGIGGGSTTFSLWNNQTTSRLDWSNILETGSWLHLALVKIGDQWTLYKNGVSQGTQTWDVLSYSNNQELLRCGTAQNFYINNYQVIPYAKYFNDFKPQ